MGNTASGQPVTQPMMRAGSSFSYPTSRQGSAFQKPNDRNLLLTQLQRIVDEQRKELSKLNQPNANVEEINAKVDALEKQKQPLRAQVGKLPVTTAEKNMMASMRSLAEPRKTAGGGPSVPTSPEPAGLFSRIGRAGLDYLQDPASRARLAMALNTMRLEPDPNLATALQARATGVQERRTQARQANRTAEYFRKQGQTELADLIEDNPDIASAAVTAMFKEPATDPSILREYAFARKQNPELSYEQFLAMKRSAGAQVTVAGDPPRDFAAEAYAKEIPARFNLIVDRGTSARRQLSDMSVLSNLLEGTDTGGSAQTKQSVMQFADRLGIPVNESQLANYQSIQALSSRLVAEELRLNKGPQTDFDAEFTGKFLPGLGQKPESNRNIIGYMNSRNLLDALLGKYVTDKRKYTTADTALLGEVEGYRQSLGSVVKVDGAFVTFEEFYNSNRAEGESDEEILKQWAEEHNR